eukprot:9127943-Pyramimonas_sp.AAC.1
MTDADCEITPLAFSWRLERVARESASKAQACIMGRSMTNKCWTLKSGGSSSSCWEGIWRACSSRTSPCFSEHRYFLAPSGLGSAASPSWGSWSFSRRSTLRIWGMSAAVGSGAEVFVLPVGVAKWGHP